MIFPPCFTLLSGPGHFSHLFAIVCLSLAVSLCYLLDPGGPWWTQSTCLRCPGAREKGNISVPTGVVCGLIALCFWILPAVPPSAIAVMATIKAVTVGVRRKLCHRQEQNGTLLCCCRNPLPRDLLPFSVRGPGAKKRRCLAQKTSWMVAQCRIPVA